MESRFSKIVVRIAEVRFSAPSKASLRHRTTMDLDASGLNILRGADPQPYFLVKEVSNLFST